MPITPLNLELQINRAISTPPSTQLKSALRPLSTLLALSSPSGSLGPSNHTSAFVGLSATTPTSSQRHLVISACQPFDSSRPTSRNHRLLRFAEHLNPWVNTPAACQRMPLHSKQSHLCIYHQDYTCHPASASSPLYRQAPGTFSTALYSPSGSSGPAKTLQEPLYAAIRHPKARPCVLSCLPFRSLFLRTSPLHSPLPAPATYSASYASPF